MIKEIGGLFIIQSSLIIQDVIDLVHPLILTFGLVKVQHYIRSNLIPVSKVGNIKGVIKYTGY